jgi:hypothetical protein
MCVRSVVSIATNDEIAQSLNGAAAGTGPHRDKTRGYVSIRSHQVYNHPQCMSRDKRRCTMEFEGYCVKCRTKRTIKQGTVVTTSKGRPMAKGKCPECGSTVTRFQSQKESKK